MMGAFSLKAVIQCFFTWHAGCTKSGTPKMWPCFEHHNIIQKNLYQLKTSGTWSWVSSFDQDIILPFSKPSKGFKLSSKSCDLGGFWVLASFGVPLFVQPACLGALLSYHYVIKLENTINLVESTPIHIFGATVSIALNRPLPLLVVVPWLSETTELMEKSNIGRYIQRKRSYPLPLCYIRVLPNQFEEISFCGWVET